ncbi:MAG TPA: CpaD family pilus assembly protein [Allosphingosinicella sp.]|nr:CpaD family pilus assembly protein [Allosphingosinicella sp.]
MGRLQTSAALLALTTAVSACGGVNQGITPYYNPGLTSANQPVVQRTDYVLDLATTGSGVPAPEQRRLSDWFDSLGLGYGDRISLDQGNGYADPRSREDIARVAGAYGLLLSEGAPVTAGVVQPGSVRVIVSRTTASVPGCPNWERGEINSRTTTSPNFGCAVNSNLAAMVADPTDLVLGQTGTGSGDAATASKAIRQYRDAPPTGASGLKSEKEGSK